MSNCFASKGTADGQARNQCRVLKRARRRAESALQKGGGAGGGGRNHRAVEGQCFAVRSGTDHGHPAFVRSHTPYRTIQAQLDLCPEGQREPNGKLAHPLPEGTDPSTKLVCRNLKTQ